MYTGHGDEVTVKHNNYIYMFPCVHLLAIA